MFMHQYGSLSKLLVKTRKFRIRCSTALRSVAHLEAPNKNSTILYTNLSLRTQFCATDQLNWLEPLMGSIGVSIADVFCKTSEIWLRSL